MNIIRYGAVALMVTATVSGQARPAFEVASIRPTAPDQNEVVVGVRITGAQLRISRWPLAATEAANHPANPVRRWGRAPGEAS